MRPIFTMERAPRTSIENPHVYTLDTCVLMFQVLDGKMMGASSTPQEAFSYFYNKKKGKKGKILMFLIIGNTKRFIKMLFGIIAIGRLNNRCLFMQLM